MLCLDRFVASTYLSDDWELVERRASTEGGISSVAMGSSASRLSLSVLEESPADVARDEQPEKSTTIKEESLSNAGKNESESESQAEDPPTDYKRKARRKLAERRRLHLSHAQTGVGGVRKRYRKKEELIRPRPAWSNRS
jgi:hypothetical protein